MGDKLEDAADKAADGLDRIRGRLDMHRAIEDFQTTMIEAQEAVHDKSAETVVDMRGVEDAIVAAGEAAGLNPIIVETAIKKAQQGDIDGAFLYMQGKIDEKGPLEVKVALNAVIPKLKLGGRGGTVIVDESSFAAPAPAPSSVTVNLPRGARYSDVARAVNVSTRRSGRRYANPVVRYARR